MTQLVVLSRELPLPPVTAGGEPVEFRTGNEDEAVPVGARAYCSTALDPVDAAFIASLPGTVGLIANIGVGVDNIDLEAAASRGIAVSNTPVVAEDTADLAFALILAACRHVGLGERHLRGGAWSDTGAMPDLGSRVHGKTLGIVGFGAIGQAVARRAAGFDMPVIYTSRTRKPDIETELKARFVDSLEELVAAADIVSLHAPLTPDTRMLIDAGVLEKFKPGAVLVNTARGALVDEAALADALAAGRLAAAGLDVFEEEPRVPAALLRSGNAVLTPHIGSATHECRGDMVTRVLGNIVAFLETGKPLDRVEAV